MHSPTATPRTRSARLRGAAFEPNECGRLVPEQHVRVQPDNAGVLALYLLPISPIARCRPLDLVGRVAARGEDDDIPPRVVRLAPVAGGPPVRRRAAASDDTGARPFARLVPRCRQPIADLAVEALDELSVGRSIMAVDACPKRNATSTGFVPSWSASVAPV